MAIVETQRPAFNTLVEKASSMNCCFEVDHDPDSILTLEGDLLVPISMVGDALVVEKPSEGKKTSEIRVEGRKRLSMVVLHRDSSPEEMQMETNKNGRMCFQLLQPGWALSSDPQVINLVRTSVKQVYVPLV